MIKTYSKFYYGLAVDVLTNKMVVKEPLKENVDVVISLPLGKYYFSEYLLVIQNALNDSLSNTYEVSIDRTTRKITITTTENFTMQVTSTGSSAYPLMGFTTNRSGASSYTGDTGSGFEYVPQFYLQDYESFDTNKKYLDGKVNTTASGKQEIISFGLVQDMKCNIKWINDFQHDVASPIITNLTGLENAISFMDYCISKGSVEFIPDKDDVDTYSVVLLLSTSDSRDGVAYSIKEFNNIVDYYQTGTLTFRKLL